LCFEDSVQGQAGAMSVRNMVHGYTDYRWFTVIATKC
jgi:hypothetical protein